MDAYGISPIAVLLSHDFKINLGDKHCRRCGHSLKDIFYQSLPCRPETIRDIEPGDGYGDLGKRPSWSP